MKLSCLATLILFLSVNAYATCPAGSQGSSNFHEAAATVSRNLDQTLRPGAHTEEIATDGRPLKIVFDNLGGKVRVTVYRSLGGLYNYKAAQAVADVCSTSGGVTTSISGYTVTITKGNGGKLAVNVRGNTYNFAALSSNTEVASDRGNSR